MVFGVSRVERCGIGGVVGVGVEQGAAVSGCGGAVGVEWSGVGALRDRDRE